ncbi:MAG: DMT family transporter [Clostridia bacterium]|nr:DMT family transporter [Clostridia bacterium]
MKKQNSPKGILFCLIAAVVWGFAFAAQALGADHLGAFTFNGARFLLGTIALVPVILIFEKNEHDAKKMKTTVIAGLCAGCALFAASWLQQVGIQLTDSAGKAGFITGLYMIIVPIFGLFLGQKTGVQSWIGAVLGVAGLFFICFDTSAGFTFTTGDIFLVACAGVFALHILIIDRFGDNIYSLRFSMVQFAAAAVLNLTMALIFEEIALSGIVLAGIPILYCGIMSTGVAYTCQTLGQKHSEPTSASILLSTESVFSAIGGALILHERMQPMAYLGCALIFAGIVLSQVKIKKNAE